ncbi:MAG: hypothetical protein JXB10_06010 [Pirellulales bacterium]|nr:hypothetical protein [Pirellulales bacterium]
MNDPGIRIALGLGIVAGGFFVANLFTPHSQAPPSPELEHSLRIRVRRVPTRPIASRSTVAKAGPVSTSPSAAPKASGGSAPQPAGPTPVVLRPQGPTPRSEAPPKYPGDAMPGHATWGMPASWAATRPAPPEPRRHIIADGDTLRNLAELYLGSADRAEEIFAANRAVLSDPHLLPIGVELTIPSRERPPTTEAQYLPPRRLVPVPTGWQGK